MENLIVYKGDTLSFGLQIQGLEGQNLSSAYLTIKADKNTGDPLIQKSLDNTFIWKDSYDAATDTLTYGFRVEPAAMNQLEPGYYDYDVQIGVNGDVFTAQAGKILVKKDVTEA